MKAILILITSIALSGLVFIGFSQYYQPDGISARTKTPKETVRGASLIPPPPPVTPQLPKDGITLNLTPADEWVVPFAVDNRSEWDVISGKVWIKTDLQQKPQLDWSGNRMNISGHKLWVAAATPAAKIFLIRMNNLQK